jgi:hypothetical protein
MSKRERPAAQTTVLRFGRFTLCIAGSVRRPSKTADSATLTVLNMSNARAAFPGAHPRLERITGRATGTRPDYPRIADWSGDLRDQSERSDDRLPHEIFRLPVQEARTKARQFLNESPAGGYTTIIENWRQLSDGQIEFTIRRLPTGPGGGF